MNEKITNDGEDVEIKMYTGKDMQNSVIVPSYQVQKP